MHSQIPELIALTQTLVQADSVTTQPNHQVSDVCAEFLEDLGFEVQDVIYKDLHGVLKTRLEAIRHPIKTSDSAGVGYFCHNDVVPIEGWNCKHSEPFDARVAEDKMWGRGTCDMKGSIATAMKAIERIPREEQQGPLYFFITGDEECGMAGASGIALDSELFDQMVRAQTPAIIGEPTSLELVHAHKGVCHLEVESRGVAAHSSTADGENANWTLIPFLAWLGELNERLETEAKYQNDTFDPQTMTMNVVLENEPQASNITVGVAKAHVFLRPMAETPWPELCEEIALKAKELQLILRQFPPLRPLNTAPEQPGVQAMLRLLDQTVANAVCYATDGCFLQALKQLLVLGPGSIEQAHRPDEFIELTQLERGVEVFESVFRRLPQL